MHKPRYVVPILLVVALLSLTVSTGFLPLSGKLFPKTEAKAATADNSQNMALPQAAGNPDPNLETSTAPAPLMEGGALLADSGPLGTAAQVNSETAGSDQISVYVVRPGDTLSEIAEMYDVSVNTILWANDLKKGTAIKEGQTLIILPISGVQHEVARGETLQSIAEKYGGDSDEIMSFNGLASEKLAVGQVLIIPDGEAIPVSAGSSPSSGSSPSGSVSPVSGYYRWPVAGGQKSQGLHGHNAIDIAAPSGTPILAAADGTVIIAKTSGWNGGYGNYVVIRHANGTQTLYAHQSQVEVRVGETVERGEEIGQIGTTGQSTGSHLHFEVRGARNPF